MTWIFFTVFAAFMQTIRTAGQKKLGVAFSPMGNTAVRYLFSLPWALLYVYLLWLSQDIFQISATNQSVASSNFSQIEWNRPFFIYGLIASICQIIATAMLVVLLNTRNFAAGTLFSKSEVMLTAIIGALFFAETLSIKGWTGIVLCTIGLLVLGFVKTNSISLGNTFSQSSLLGFGSGLGFALTALYIREATHTLAVSPYLASALCLVYMVSLQSILMIIYLVVYEPKQFTEMKRQWGKACFIGVTSILGSIGWFTAVSLVQASSVRAVGQIELLFAIIITRVFFKESPSRQEWLGIFITVLGIALVIDQDSLSAQ